MKNFSAQMRAMVNFLNVPGTPVTMSKVLHDKCLQNSSYT